MKTSLVELQFIEEHFLNGAPLPAELQHNDNVQWQAHTYQLITAYGRAQLKEELQTVHQQLLGGGTWTRFKRRVMRHFR